MLILLNSVSRLRVVLFLLNISKLRRRSICLPINFAWYARWKSRFWHILDLERELMCLKVSLDLLVLQLVSSSLLWQRTLCKVMVEVELCCIFKRSHIILILYIRSSTWGMRQDIHLWAKSPMRIHYLIAEPIIFHLRDIGLSWNVALI